MNRDLMNRMDAYDDAHDLRKRLAHRFMAVTPTKRTQAMKIELDEAIEAEEKARMELEQLERKLSGLWPEGGE